MAERGGLYEGLCLLGMLTALLTSVYTFRMVYLVFGGDGPQPHPAPRLMEWVLLPLALFGLLGGMLNLPEYLGGGWLDLFMGLHGEGEAHGSHTAELALQAIAALLALAGLAIAHLRYGGKRRSGLAAAPAGQVESFFLNGWRFDDLYSVLFVRPFKALSRLLWERVDEAVIDDSLDRLANLFGKTGQALGSWTTGKVSVYLLSLAGGLALILVYLAWVVL